MPSETLHFENARFAQHLYNNDPRNLQSLEEQLGVKAVCREGWIKLDGAAEAIERARQLFASLQSLLQAGSPVKNREFLHALNVVKHEGGTALKESRGSEYYANIGRSGGVAVKEKHGPGYYSEIGKKGGQKVAELIAGDYFVARVKTLGDGEPYDEREMDVLVRSVVSQFEQYVKLNRKVPPEILTSLAGIEQAGRAIGDAIGGVDESGDVGDLALNGAELDDRGLELLAVGGVLHRFAQSTTRAAGGDATQFEPADVEDVESDLVAGSDRPEHVRHRHVDVLENQLASR